MVVAAQDVVDAQEHEAAGELGGGGRGLDGEARDARLGSERELLRARRRLDPGQGVVVGMLGCFLIGLAWIVVYYVFGQTGAVPVLRDLGQYNLVVGIGFMAVGFVYATHWE